MALLIRHGTQNPPDTALEYLHMGDHGVFRQWGGILCPREWDIFKAYSVLHASLPSAECHGNSSPRGSTAPAQRCSGSGVKEQPGLEGPGRPRKVFRARLEDWRWIGLKRGLGRLVSSFCVCWVSKISCNMGEIRSPQSESGLQQSRSTGCYPWMFGVPIIHSLDGTNQTTPSNVTPG